MGWRPRQPDVAGAERAVISDWVRSSRLYLEFSCRKPVGRAVPSLRRTSTASSKGSAAGDASMSSVRSMRGV